MDKKSKKKKTLQYFKYFINKQFKSEKLTKENEIQNSPMNVLKQELSKPIYGPGKVHFIILYGSSPDIESSFERNIDLIIYSMKKYKNCERFIKIHNISEKSLLILGALGVLKHYKKDEPIYLKKDKVEEFYFIIKGNVIIKSLEPTIIKKEIKTRKHDCKSEFQNIEDEEMYDRYYNCPNDFDIANNISKSNFISECSEISNNELENNIYINEKENPFKNNKLIKLDKYDKKRHVILIPEYNINTKRRSNISNEYIRSFSEFQKIIQLQKDLGCAINNFIKGDFFGEWDLIYNKTHTNSAYAEEDTDLLILDKSYFKEYFRPHILNSDLKRKFFIKSRIPILNIKAIPLLIPEFCDKGDIIYTEYDSACDFFILYKGLGALKQLKFSKSKKDILYNSDKMETLLIIDKGCIVGLECSKNHINNNLYDNTFIITEQNTIILRINLKYFDFNKELKMNLINFLKNLYQKQTTLIENYKMKISNLKIIKQKILSKSDEIKPNIMNKRISSFEKVKKLNYYLNVSSLNNNLPIRRESLNNNSKFTLTNDKQIKINGLISPKSRSRNSKFKVKKRDSVNDGYITPFVTYIKTNNNKHFKLQSFADNPINLKNYNYSISSNLNKLKKHNLTNFSQNNINPTQNKSIINKLRDSPSKRKSNNNIKKIIRNKKRNTYDDSLFKMIFNKHYRKIDISYNNSYGKKHIFLYNSGNFDIPLLTSN